MTALFHAKLIKAGKKVSNINLQLFERNQIKFKVDFISDSVILKLLQQNCFLNKDTLIKELFI